MWQRFNWFRPLAKSILTFGLGTLAICTAILFALLPFFPFWDALWLFVIYMYGTPVVVLIAVIIGWVKFTKNTNRGYQTPTISWMTVSPTNKPVDAPKMSSDKYWAEIQRLSW